MARCPVSLSLSTAPSSRGASVWGLARHRPVSHHVTASAATRSRGTQGADHSVAWLSTSPRSLFRIPGAIPRAPAMPEANPPIASIATTAIKRPVKPTRATSSAGDYLPIRPRSCR